MLHTFMIDDAIAESKMLEENLEKTRMQSWVINELVA